MGGKRKAAQNSSDVPAGKLTSGLVGNMIVKPGAALVLNTGPTSIAQANAVRANQFPEDFGESNSAEINANKSDGGY